MKKKLFNFVTLLCRHLLSVATSGDGKCSIYIFDDPYKLLISINIKLNAIA